MSVPPKSLLLFCFLLALPLLSAQANLRVPSGVYFSEDLEKAREEAAEKGLGILLVNVDHAGGNRVINDRAQAVMRAVRSDAVVVLVPTQGIEAAHNINIPENFRMQFRQRLMPGYPKVLLVDREMSGITHRLLAADLANDERGELRRLVEKAKELAENQGLGAGAAPVDPEMAGQADEAAPGDPAPAAQAPLRFQNFTNQEGNTIRAAVLAVDGATVKFRREDGVEFDYPLAQLADESQQRVRESVEPAAAP